ncbi:MAG: L-threonylcarbamoyladenylate synthase [Candidatus Competibacteraceae bacterium]|nr:L-threonylcarbamoyladenylate synthase [Candidatus Competibacteraceae bacterium]
MSQFFQIHPETPQPRLVRRAMEILRQGGVLVYPTDSSYALGCRIGEKNAMARIQLIRRTDKEHNFTLVCRDLSEIATYARVDNIQYRLLKAATPGPFTFILRATSEVPRRLQNPKRRTIGIRVPEHVIVRTLLEDLGEPILSTTLILPGEDVPLNDMDEVRLRLEKQVDLIIDGGHCGHQPTTVLDLVEGVPTVLRQGKGDAAPFLAD